MEENIQQDDNEQMQNLVLGAKLILELMEDSKEKVTVLQGSLKQQEDLSNTLQNNLDALKTLYNRNTGFLESNEDFKANFKEHNEKFFDFAQLIYSSCQELYKELNLHMTASKQTEELLVKYGENFLLKVKETDIKGKQLQEKLTKMNKNQLEEDKQLEWEKNENLELKLEIEKLNKKIEEWRVNVDGKEEALNNQKVNLIREIEQTSKTLKVIDDEFVTFSRSLENSEEKECEITLKLENTIKELNEEILKNEADMELKTNEIVKLNKLEDDVQNQLQALEQCIKIINEKHEQYKTDVNEVLQKIKETEENGVQQIVSYKSSIDQYQESLREKKESNDQLSNKINLLTGKVEEVLEENNKMREYVNNEKKMQTTDFGKEIEKLDIEYTEIKATMQIMKKQYSHDLSELEIKMRNEKLEVHKLESNIKKQNQDIADLESIISQCKTQENTIVSDMSANNNVVADLDEEIKRMKVKIEGLDKENKIKYVSPKVPLKYATKPRSQLFKRAELKRHWDSDSSMEGVDRSLFFKGKARSEKNAPWSRKINHSTWI